MFGLHIFGLHICSTHMLANLFIPLLFAVHLNGMVHKGEDVGVINKPRVTTG